MSHAPDRTTADGTVLSTAVAVRGLLEVQNDLAGGAAGEKILERLPGVRQGIGRVGQRLQRPGGDESEQLSQSVAIGPGLAQRPTEPEPGHREIALSENCRVDQRAAFPGGVAEGDQPAEVAEGLQARGEDRTPMESNTRSTGAPLLAFRTRSV
jgi:hypothetical protein